jgi:hypothetical protein
MADKRELDDLCDEFLGSVLSAQALVISSFYFFGCLIFGVGFWKSCAIRVASYVPMVLPVGRKYVELLAFYSLPSQWQPGLNFFQLRNGRQWLGSTFRFSSSIESVRCRCGVPSDCRTRFEQR